MGLVEDQGIDFEKKKLLKIITQKLKAVKTIDFSFCVCIIRFHLTKSNLKTKLQYLTLNPYSKRWRWIIIIIIVFEEIFFLSLDCLNLLISKSSTELIQRQNRVFHVFEIFLEWKKYQFKSNQSRIQLCHFENFAPYNRVFDWADESFNTISAD